MTTEVLKVCLLLLDLYNAVTCFRMRKTQLCRKLERFLVRVHGLGCFLASNVSEIQTFAWAQLAHIGLVFGLK